MFVLIEYSINIHPLKMTNDVPRVHTLNKCAAHISDQFPLLRHVTFLLFLEGENRTSKSIRTKRPKQSPDPQRL